jgi:hypothetical protein
VKRLLDGPSGQNVAASIQSLAHPTGSTPKLNGYRVLRVGEALSVTIDAGWKGGITHNSYVTQVVWEFDKNNSKASVRQDNAPTPVSSSAPQKLDDYFRTE